MLKILKAEINYFMIPLIAIALLPLSFTIFTAADIHAFLGFNFFEKYFWSLIFGFGTYGFVFIIWTLRKKEVRDRLHSTLPVSLNQTAIIRWLFGIAPFILIWIYLELLRNVIPEDQTIFINRINAQMGLMFIALASFDFIINSDNSITNGRYIKILLISLALIFSSLGVIFLVTISVIPRFPFGGGEFYFTFWGLVISVISMLIFTNRKSFLG